MPIGHYPSDEPEREDPPDRDSIIDSIIGTIRTSGIQEIGDV